MSNQEWKELIAKEFGVSNTVAKGMLHAMYQAKKYLEIPADVHRQREEEQERLKRQMEEWAYQDWCDAEFMERYGKE